MEQLHRLQFQLVQLHLILFAKGKMLFQPPVFGYEDLDAALLMGLEMTAEDMAQRGNPLHTNTAQAIAWLRGRRGV